MTDDGASVLVVDDHEGFREVARTLLTSMGLLVVGDVETGEQALEAVERLRPDIVLLDVQLPGMDGIDVARRLVAEPDPPTVVLTSSRDAEDYGARLRAVPAAAFIAKMDLSQESLDAAIGGRS